MLKSIYNDGLEGNMEQIERIELMEKHLERASKAVIGLSGELEDFADVQAPDLKRGVLSEDGIWNLLEDVRTLKERMQQIVTFL